MAVGFADAGIKADYLQRYQAHQKRVRQRQRSKPVQFSSSAQLNDIELSLLHKAADKVRAEAETKVPWGRRISPANLVKNAFSQFANNPLVKLFVDNFQKADFTEYWRRLNFLESLGRGPNFLLLRLKESPLSPDILEDSAEMLSFDRLKIHPELPKRYPKSKFIPIKLKDTSAGFDDPLAVAVFSENVIGNRYDHNNSIMYAFMGKMAERYMESSAGYIDSAKISDRSFDLIRNLSKEEVMKLTIPWIYAHEHYHRDGLLPFPDNVEAKQAFEGAPFEETRVDTNVILDIYDNLSKTSYGRENAMRVCQYILASRLTYAMRTHPMLNQDSKTSVLWWQQFTKTGALHWDAKTNVLDFDFEKAIDSLRELRNGIDQAEAEAALLDDDQPIKDFVRDLYGEYRAGKLYKNPQFFMANSFDKAYMQEVSERLEQGDYPEILDKNGEYKADAEFTLANWGNQVLG